MLKKIILGFIFLLIIAIGIFSLFAFGTYSKGEKAGTLVKLSEKGVIFKTWEGELNTYMVVSDQAAASAAVTNLFTFSVLSSDKEVIETIQSAIHSGHRITLYYKEKYFKFPWNGDTKYFIYKAEIEKK
jgi:hypothetical protein